MHKEKISLSPDQRWMAEVEPSLSTVDVLLACGYTTVNVLRTQRWLKRGRIQRWPGDLKKNPIYNLFDLLFIPKQLSKILNILIPQEKMSGSSPGFTLPSFNNVVFRDVQIKKRKFFENWKPRASCIESFFPLLPFNVIWCNTFEVCHRFELFS